jgi:hypothetical protein
VIEFDCCECGTHIVDVVGLVREPPLCTQSIGGKMTDETLSRVEELKFSSTLIEVCSAMSADGVAMIGVVLPCSCCVLHIVKVPRVHGAAILKAVSAAEGMAVEYTSACAEGDKISSQEKAQ